MTVRSKYKLAHDAVEFINILRVNGNLIIWESYNWIEPQMEQDIVPTLHR